MSKSLVSKVMMKLASPILGSFYILDGNIYYSTLRTGLLHPDLWKIISQRAFPDMEDYTKEILEGLPFGADRGRVTWKGQFDHLHEKPMGEGKYLIEASKGCAKFEDKIKSIFKLNNLDEGKLEIHYSDNGSYKIMSDEKHRLERIFKETELKLKDTHVAHT